MVKAGQERRTYLRVVKPLNIRTISKQNVIQEAQTKDISPRGFRFEAKKDILDINEAIEVKLELPKAPGVIHARAKVAWKRKLSAESGAPSDVGCEFTKIEEDNKNTFLKYFCDLLYECKSAIGEKGE